ncbi:hypothetical protein BU23DRAFT_565074 [Bimuria novae-zelandiae CBS 107.79]|uniref:Uncharacterized protein n=1 Tax=Bimuria novae-zelandiae CBS 107.79 TaxID=1447943 RepID=A0A6A5VRS9_9PLEO|nr:hypothetical protein BU23DRAFT_565074 [Bimuria novae-zelandiae CBS 107.79]
MGDSADSHNVDKCEQADIRMPTIEQENSSFKLHDAKQPLTEQAAEWKRKRQKRALENHAARKHARKTSKAPHKSTTSKADSVPQDPSITAQAFLSRPVSPPSLSPSALALTLTPYLTTPLPSLSPLTPLTTSPPLPPQNSTQSPSSSPTRPSPPLSPPSPHPPS